MTLRDPILRIALPSIVSNITVPLLGLVDTAIAGHLGTAAYLGAIAVGGMIFNMLYWLFGFLRMGTGGLTAQAYGASRTDESLRILARSLSLAFAVALLFILLQGQVLELTFRFVTPTPGVERLARLYFSILIWGAPAVMGLYSFTGWFIGMQNARYPMYIAITQNVINIAASFILVYGMGWKVEGIAAGTLIAQYSGFVIAIALWKRKYSRPHMPRLPLETIWNRAAMCRFFSVNRDIFLRTLCLVAVTTSFTSFGTAMGELTLAANTLLMQLFVIFSYFMDGFAYAGEALGGRYAGAADQKAFLRLTRRLFVWGTGLSLTFTALYLLGGTALIGLLTTVPEVISAAGRFLFWPCLIPIVSFPAFLFDGLFIGTTATRQMLLSMAAATAIFFLLHSLLPFGNTALWSAFLAYLGMRGMMQALLFRGVLKTTFGQFHKKLF